MPGASVPPPHRENAGEEVLPSRMKAVAGPGIDVLRTPIAVQRANAICERLVGSIRRACLDHLLILSDAHLWRIRNAYVRYFNRSRLHQGINQRVPEPGDTSASSVHGGGNVVAFPVLGGLHHAYRKVA